MTLNSLVGQGDYGALIVRGGKGFPKRVDALLRRCAVLIAAEDIKIN